MILSSVGDESVVDTEERRYYQQNYQFQLQGFLIDEEEFEVTPAISRVVTLMGGENRNSKVNDTVSTKTKFEFGSSPVDTIQVKIYVTKVNLSIIRSSNILNYVIHINGTMVLEPAMVSPNDTVTVYITKVTPTDPAWITFQETIVR